MSVFESLPPLRILHTDTDTDTDTHCRNEPRAVRGWNASPLLASSTTGWMQYSLWTARVTPRTRCKERTRACRRACRSAWQAGGPATSVVSDRPSMRAIGGMCCARPKPRRRSSTRCRVERVWWQTMTNAWRECSSACKRCTPAGLLGRTSACSKDGAACTAGSRRCPAVPRRDAQAMSKAVALSAVLVEGATGGTQAAAFTNGT